MPHELGPLPLTYFQTLLNRVSREYAPTKLKVPEAVTRDEDSDVLDVDVDALIRRGQRVQL